MLNENQPIPLENIPPENPPVPWTFRDTWIGFALFIVFMVGIALLPRLLPKEGWVDTVWLLLYQPLQFIPILILLLMRRATWADLGLRKAQPNVMALGCGLLVLAFFVNLVNNFVMWKLGMEVQGEQFAGLLASLDQPAVLLITGILIAPLFEESIFRGFLFGGLRQKLGWIWAATISSVIFAVGHGSIAAFIPTFTLGFLFCYLYQQSKSIWPGIILHTLVNSFSLCAILTIVKYFPNLI